METKRYALMGYYPKGKSSEIMTGPIEHVYMTALRIAINATFSGFKIIKSKTHLDMYSSSFRITLQDKEDKKFEYYYEIKEL